MQAVIQFHLDQHVHSAVARGLTLRGVDVTTTTEAGLQNASDQQHLAFALSERRVTFTLDRDFVRMHHQGVPHAGIVYSKQGARSIGQVIHFLELMSQCLDPKDMMGQLEYF